MKKKPLFPVPIFSILCVFLAGLLGIVCITFTAVDGITIFYRGFAVDSAGNLYLGKSAEIQVYQPDGSALRTLRPQTARGYGFTISPEDQILLNTGVDLYTLDLEGNVLRKEPVTSQNSSLVPMNLPKAFTAADGTRYERREPLLRTTIYRLRGTERAVVYEMPLPDYLARLSIPLIIIVFLVNIPIIFLRIEKSTKTSLETSQDFESPLLRR